MNESKLFDMMVKRVNFKGIEDEIAKNTIDKINKSINPELLTNFNIMYQEITRIFNHFEPIIKKLEKQSKKVINCETLYFVHHGRSFRACASLAYGVRCIC